MHRKYLYPAVFIGLLTCCLTSTSYSTEKDVGDFLKSPYACFFKNSFPSCDATKEVLAAEAGVRKQEQEIESRLKYRWVLQSKSDELEKALKKTKKQLANQLLDLAHTVSSGAVDEFDPSLAPVFANHALSFMGVPYTKRNEPYRIATAKLCHTEMQRTLDRQKQILWARRALQILPLNFEKSGPILRYADMSAVFSTAIDILEALKDPIQRVQSPLDLPPMTDSSFNVEFPAECALGGHVDWYLALCHEKELNGYEESHISTKKDIIRHSQHAKEAYQLAIDESGNSAPNIMAYWHTMLARLNDKIGDCSIKYDYSSDNDDRTDAQPFLDLKNIHHTKAARGYENLAGTILALQSDGVKPRDDALKYLIQASSSYYSAKNYKKSLALGRKAWNLNPGYCRHYKTFRWDEPVHERYEGYPRTSLVTEAYAGLLSQQHPEWLGKALLLNDDEVRAMYEAPVQESHVTTMELSEETDPDYQSGYQKAQLDVAKQLLASGMSTEQVAKFTKLGKAVITKLQSQN